MGLVVLSTSSGAGAAAPDTYGGGSIAAAEAYVGSSWLTTSRLVTTPDAGSLFAAVQAVHGDAVSYCVVDFGSQVLNGTFDATDKCHTIGSQPAGFDAPDADANFVAAESPVTDSDLSAFAANKPGRGQPVQVPAIGSAVAVVYRNSDPAVAAARITLTEAQICGIFAGTIADWSQLDPAFAPKPIKVAYLNGTTNGASFAFSNHLSAVCPTVAPAVTGFSTQVNFAQAFPNATPPSGAIVTGQNGGMVTEVDATDGAIGYTPVADAMARRATLTQFDWAKVAKASGIVPGTRLKYRALDPSQNTQQFSLPASAWLADSVLVLPAPPATRATLQPGGGTFAQPGCSMTVDPDSYATSKLNANGDYAVYPITNVSYLIGYSAGNGVDEHRSERVLHAPYSADVRNLTTSVGAGTGYYWLQGRRPSFKAIKDCVQF